MALHFTQGLGDSFARESIEGDEYKVGVELVGGTNLGQPQRGQC